MEQDLILGELKEFKRATLSDLQEIKSDIQELKKFRWKIDGRNAALVVLLSGVTSLIGVWIFK